MILVTITINNKTKTLTDTKDIPLVCALLNATEQFQKTTIEELSDFAADHMSNVKALFGGSQTFNARKREDVSESHFERFTMAYYAELEARFALDHDGHRYTLDETFHRTVAAIFRQSFIKDTQAFKDTCKVLKIKHTYKAIEAFIQGK